MEIVWGDPPPRQRGKRSSTVWTRRLTPLMERPNEWAMVADYPTERSAITTASALRNGRLRIPEGRWEFEWGPFDGRGGLWARYLGPSAPGAEA